MVKKLIKAAVIWHNSCEGSNALINKLERMIYEVYNHNSSIIIGPDYGLNKSIETPNSEKEWESLLCELKKLSKVFNCGLIIPGTSSIKEGKFMKVVCPVFYKGKLYVTLEKETDRGESSIAENFKLSYHRGDSKKNNLKNVLGLENISIQICSDHGKQQIPENTALEIILAYDSFAGYYIGTNLNSFKDRRFAIVCDGYQPKIEVFEINRDPEINKLKVNLVRPIKKIEGIGEIYDLYFNS